MVEQRIKASSFLVLLVVFQLVNGEDPYRFFTWNVTYGDIYPLGVKQQGILINGQFPGPQIDSVTNDNLIINVFNSLDEPFLLSCSGVRGAAIAALIPGVHIFKVLLIGLGIVKDEATVKSMSRFGDYRELIKGPMYYAITITLCCAFYWRTSPIAIAGICNLCAGDGIADIIGRRFGKKKIPYNKDKSIAGSIAMASAGCFVSVGYMYYFSMFGFVDKSLKMVAGFLAISLASALVESHPISTKFDDNLTVPLVSVLLGTLVFS